MVFTTHSFQPRALNGESDGSTQTVAATAWVNHNPIMQFVGKEDLGQKQSQEPAQGVPVLQDGKALWIGIKPSPTLADRQETLNHLHGHICADVVL